MMLKTGKRHLSKQYWFLVTVYLLCLLVHPSFGEAGSDATVPGGTSSDTIPGVQERQTGSRNLNPRDFTYPIIARWVKGISDKLSQLEKLKVSLFTTTTQAALIDVVLNRANAAQSTQYLSEGLYAMVGDRGVNQINNLMSALTGILNQKKSISPKGMKRVVKAYNAYIKALPAEALQDPNEAVAILWWFLSPSTKFGQIEQKSSAGNR